MSKAEAVPKQYKLDISNTGILVCLMLIVVSAMYGFILWSTIPVTGCGDCCKYKSAILFIQYVIGCAFITLCVEAVVLSLICGFFNVVEKDADL